MRLKKQHHFIIGFFAIGISLLMLNSLGKDEVRPTTLSLSLNPHAAKIYKGDVFAADLIIDAGVPINALGATLSYPKAKLRIASIDTDEEFFDLWTEKALHDEGMGEVRLSGGTLKKGGFVGEGVVLRITFEALDHGSLEFSFRNVLAFAHDGKGTPVNVETRGLATSVAEKQETTMPRAVEQETKPQKTKEPVVEISQGSLEEHHPDVNGDGKINLVDASIVWIKVFGSYDPRYDLNGDGKISGTDVNFVFSKLLPF